MGSHVVSELDASSPAAFVIPGGHDMQVYKETYSLAEHKMGSHVVSLPLTSSPASFVVLTGHGVQTLEET